MEIEQTGKVLNIRNDGKGVQLDNEEWYSNKFLRKNLNCKKGDTVKVSLNGKGFLEDLEVLESGPADKSTEATLYKQASVMISYAKDLAVADKIKVADIAKISKGFMNLQEELVHGMSEMPEEE